LIQICTGLIKVKAPFSRIARGDWGFYDQYYSPSESGSVSDEEAASERGSLSADSSVEDSSVGTNLNEDSSSESGNNENVSSNDDFVESENHHSDYSSANSSYSESLVQENVYSGDEFEEGYETEYSSSVVSNYDHAAKWFSLPMLSFPSSKIHSITVRGLWRDQGWGNRKGILAILSGGNDHNAITNYLDNSDSESGVVSIITVAPHQWETFELTFFPDPLHHINRGEEGEEEYELWYRIGGGGGHELFIKKLTVEILPYCV